MPKDLSAIKETKLYKSRLPLLKELIDAFSLPDEERPKYFGDMLAYFLGDHADLRSLPVKTGLEISVYFNEPTDHEWSRFVGRVRDGATSKEYMTYSDNFDEGITITYLKLCLHHGRRL